MKDRKRKASGEMAYRKGDGADIMSLLNAPVTDLYTGRGSHAGCGECCSRILPLTISETFMLAAEGKRLSIEPHQRAGSVDMRCPFLDGEMRCRIYDKRPAICRAFTCESGRTVNFDAFRNVREYAIYDVVEILGGRAIDEEIAAAGGGRR